MEIMPYMLQMVDPTDGPWVLFNIESCDVLKFGLVLHFVRLWKSLWVVAIQQVTM